MGEFAFFVLDEGRQEDEFAAKREFEDFIDDVFGATTCDGATANRAVWNADASKKEAEVVVDFSDGGDGGAGIAGGGFLVDADGGGEATDMIDVGLVHDAEEHAGVRTEAFDIATLAFGVNGIEGKAGFAGAGKAGNDD